jgi:hypothetical protein
MLPQSSQAAYLYEALFDWQSPFSLWEKSESLKDMLGDDLLSSRDAGDMEIKRVLEGWVIGKSLSMAYHGSPALVRVARTPALDGQIYHDRLIGSVEVTQALYPGRKRNVFGKPYGGLLPPLPVAPGEQAAYESYRDEFVRQAFLQVEARIEHKFQLYRQLDYLLVYVDLFDMQNPRFSYFALQEFYEEYGDDLEARLTLRFRTRWSSKISHLFLLDDRPTGFVTRFAPTQSHHAELSLA